MDRIGQLLLNVFAKWCKWADFMIRVDKCHAFGIKKTTTESVQYQPYLTICQKQIPPVKVGESFTYLGKKFNFKMSTNEVD